MTVSFGESIGEIPVSDDARALAVGLTIPWWDDRGFLSSALWWAKAGFGVFPLLEANSGGTHAGKVPLLPGSASDASRQLRRRADIETVWKARPFCNIGIVTMAQRVLVIDLDPRDGGRESFIEFAAHIDLDLADVPRQTSPRNDGGVHLFWRLADDAPVIKTGSPLDGVDIPWQVPVAPSLRHVEVGLDHQNQPVMGYRPYLWTAGDPRKLPVAPSNLVQGLADLGRVKGVKSKVSAKTSKFGAVSTDIAELLETGIPHGRQNNTVQALATSMARRGVLLSDAIETIAKILAVSPQDAREPWTYADLYGSGVPGTYTWRPGIVSRAYDFIAADRAQDAARDPDRQKWAESLFASMIHKG